MRKKTPNAISDLIVLAAILILGCDSKDPVKPESEPTFNSFREEVEYVIESTFTFGGVALGVIRDGEAFNLFHGEKSKNSDNLPDENTIYEMGSVTKTFTTTLLADHIVNDRVGLHDEVRAYLPADSVTLPTYNGAEISLWHLATHTASLPKNFSDNYPLPPGTPETDPFAGIRSEHVYDYLTNYVTLNRAPGNEYEYSNLGVGLLGLILSRINETTYETLLKETVLDVLGMDQTSIVLNDAQRGNMAVGYNEWTNEIEAWSSDHVLVGCGSLKSNLKDMMTFLKANMGLLDSSLNASIALALQPQFANFICLGWFLFTFDDGQIITCHGGAAAGHMTFIEFNRSTQMGVVMLYNMNSSLFTQDVALSIFEIAGKYE